MILSKDEYFVIRQVAAESEVAGAEILLGLKEAQGQVSAPVATAPVLIQHPPPAVYPNLMYIDGQPNRG